MAQENEFDMDFGETLPRVLSPEELRELRGGASLLADDDEANTEPEED